MNKRSVLLIDDDADFSRLTSSFLEGRGYHVDIAQTAPEAFEKIGHRPDVILLDRILRSKGQHSDGLQICQRIKENKAWRCIPIIMITALGAPKHVIEGLYMGADDYLSKPFYQEELVARIEAVIRRAQMVDISRLNQKHLFIELKKILETGAIASYFQPIFSFPSFKVLGVEALNRPCTTAFKSPEIMFKTALLLGQYHSLEALCWRKSIDKWKRFRRGEKLFLNCTPFLIETGDHDRNLSEVLAISDPSQIVLEITELMEITDYELFFKRLNHFRQKGFKIAVDDVGHGYASLEMVARLRPDFVKIDKCFINNAHQEMLKKDIIESIVFFCRKGNITTIAEGIEAVEELALVRMAGVGAGQGYLLARPDMEMDFDVFAGMKREFEP